MTILSRNVSNFFVKVVLKNSWVKFGAISRFNGTFLFLKSGYSEPKVLTWPLYLNFLNHILYLRNVECTETFNIKKVLIK